jgi:tRNA(Ile)-lysidine synthase
MLRLFNKIPDSVSIACSGGPDSMAVVDFLSRTNRDITIAHFDHGTEHASDARKFVESFCRERDLKLSIGDIGSRTPEKGRSLEDWWREQRYSFFDKIKGPIITAHNLDDAIEWWIFTSLRGNSRVMPYRNGKIIKPFILTRKSEMMNWCKSKEVDFVIDPSNTGDRFARSYIRKNMIHHALNINPGLYKVISKKIVSENTI